ncbi:MAG TPA: DUF881 domain-containing protein [Mycobacteriales bacterium]|nr:DUF881 domain-containing protein [Mycobacteriales bacterium]
MRSSRAWWRVMVPVVAAAGGLLLATSAVTAKGTDLRASRTLQVSQLIMQEQRTLAALTREDNDLRDRISAATALAAVGDRRVRDLRSAADRLAAAAGLTPVTGPAVTVALDDVPRSEQQRDLAAGARPDDLVIHQQDVQGVVNALWAGGAEAMTVMGERVIATTAVRCVGNTLLLRGRVFSPPFTITAVGDVSRMQQALAADPAVQIFQQYVAVYGLGYTLTTSPRTTLPAYDGPLELTSATAVNG